jgi:hypothetical protein
MIDVGAGKGELCVLALLQEKMQHVQAFEPQESETELLAQNMEANGVGTPDTLTVSNQFVGMNDAVGISKLDRLKMPQGPGFIKIDVEGAELDVLKSA